MKKYYPILLSKSGELGALLNLSDDVKNDVSPVIEILDEDGMSSVETFGIDHWGFADNEILVDFSYFPGVDAHISKIRTFLTNLIRANVNVIPVTQQTLSSNYFNLLSALARSHNINICIRISNASDDFTDLPKVLDDLTQSMGNNRNRVILLIDLGYVSDKTVNMLSALAVNSLKSLKDITSWKGIIVASGSFPENLTDVKPANKLHRLTRYEWIVWARIQREISLKDVVRYGDYGTKYPFYKEVGFAGTCSVKYTAEDDFLIYKGELSGDHAYGNGQYIVFSKRLVASSDYFGSSYSWGDKKIYEISQEDETKRPPKSGNATTWVKISQNHHITVLKNLL